MAQDSINLRYLLTPAGLLKLLITLCLVISLSLGAHAFEKSLYNNYYRYWQAVKATVIEDNFPGLVRERCFIAFTSIGLVTIVYSLFTSVFGGSPPSKISSIVFHVFGALLLIIAGAFLFDSARRITRDGCSRIVLEISDFKCQFRAEKDFGGIFALIAAVLHLVSVVLHVLPGRFGTGSSSAA